MSRPTDSSLRPISSEIDLAAGQDRDVLQHRLTAIAEARSLHRNRVERAADLVDDERGESLALDVLGDDQERLAGLDDLLQDGQQVADVRDLALNDQDVSVLEDGLHALLVGDEVRRDVALVELHALDELELEPEGVRLLDGDDAVLTDLVHRLGDHLADLGVVVRGDRRDVGDLLTALDVAATERWIESTAAATAFSMPRFERHRVGAGGDVLEPGCEPSPGRERSRWWFRHRRRRSSWSRLP